MLRNQIAERDALTKLNRHELQVLAKKSGVNAGKTSDKIIKELQKLNGSIPRPAPIVTNPGVAQGAKRKRKAEVSAEEEEKQPKKQKTSLEVSTPHPATYEPSPWQAYSASPPKPKDSSTRLIIRIPKRSPASPTPPSKKGTSVRKPSEKEVRQVRRDMVKTVNDSAAVRQELDDLGKMLAFSRKLVDDMVKDSKEMCLLSSGMMHVVTGMRFDRTVWDGTGLMKPEARERWEGFLQELEEEEDEERENKMKARQRQIDEEW